MNRIFANRPTVASAAQFIERLPEVDVLNNAGAPAYSFGKEHALVQLAVTGCFNHTFYCSPEQQLTKAKELAEGVEPIVLAKIALYARQSAYMKDMPSFLLAVLSKRSPELFEQIFSNVIDSVKMLRNFVQIMRSGTVGSQSLGSLPRRKVREWLDQISDEQLFKQSVGGNPSLSDLIKIIHPKPKKETRSALYQYFLGRTVDFEKLPPIVQSYEKFKSGQSLEVPDVPFQFLDGLKTDPSFWRTVALNASWQATRMNLNTFKRHGVLDDPTMVELIAKRLADPVAIAQAKVFPYQLLVAYKTVEDMPFLITEALQNAMEIATANIPAFQGRVVLCPDVSGSMKQSVTGNRSGATSKVNCIDVAALVSASVLRRNPSALVLPFERDVVALAINPRDSIMTNATKLAGVGGGGTNCAAPLQLMVAKRMAPDLIIVISDNESWIDANGYDQPTQFMQAWRQLKLLNPNLKLVCIDITPSTTTQALENDSILHVGGFSDSVFNVIGNFAQTQSEDASWLRFLEEVQMDGLNEKDRSNATGSTSPKSLHEFR